MARYGQWMLQSLKLQYCDWNGSSRGMREFVERQLPAFKAANPQVSIATHIRRSRFPFIEAQYRPVCPGQPAHVRTVGVKNLEAKEILEHLVWLRSTQGRNTRHRVPPAHQISRRPSIQGTWTPTTFAGAPLQQQQQQQAQRGASA